MSGLWEKSSLERLCVRMLLAVSLQPEFLPCMAFGILSFIYILRGSEMAYMLFKMQQNGPEESCVVLVQPGLYL
jgi:hypothetical protein